MNQHPETRVLVSLLAEIESTFEGLANAPPKQLALFRSDIEILLGQLRSDWLKNVTGYFKNHRPDSPYAELDDEYKVQDLLYCLVSSFVPDLQYENPKAKPRGGLSSTRVDFSSSQLKLLLEAKHISSAAKARRVEKEMSEDLTKYGRQKGFQTLVFYVFTYNYHLPNRREFELGFTGEQVVDGHRFESICIVGP